MKRRRAPAPDETPIEMLVLFVVFDDSEDGIDEPKVGFAEIRCDEELLGVFVDEDVGAKLFVVDDVEPVDPEEAGSDGEL